MVEAESKAPVSLYTRTAVLICTSYRLDALLRAGPHAVLVVEPAAQAGVYCFIAPPSMLSARSWRSLALRPASSSSSALHSCSACALSSVTTILRLRPAPSRPHEHSPAHGVQTAGRCP
eukprot:5595979-Prymnesium_polylepis.1